MSQPGSEREGVIKYQLEHHFSGLEPVPGFDDLAACRRKLFKACLLGQDPLRYDGLGFGNISLRLPEPRGFLVSGTQTGGLPDPGPEAYAEVLTCDPLRGTLVSAGQAKPSSESLTHAQIYAFSPSVRAVVHVHSPELWRGAAGLGLPVTPIEAAYGTTAMVLAVQALWDSGALNTKRLFAMGGHEDGIIAFGASPGEAAQWIFNSLGEL